MDVYLDDAVLAAELADSAGHRLRQIRERAGARGLGSKALKEAGDSGSQKYLAGALADRRPSDAILSEEAQDGPSRLRARRVWIIDPLDGTREYAEGRADWAVHVALWAAGELVAGAVALPDLGEVLGTGNPIEPPPVPPGRFRIAVSRTRPPEEARLLERQPGVELVPMGSAGYKISAVVRGDVDAYLHSGGQYEWDSAAPVAVARRAGLHASRLDGSALAYNRADPYLPDLLVCRTPLAEPLLAALRN
ncbi:3'(2'),5'-bisphosphate nucleotidase CysQ [Georgenia sp. AZ-5]|uniref:3'(2'),5'-bisphosphate nucleotidase CysQ n=1 Tax=Georgenia sp. AZ-5 TaxID=3367526 RepID=UPI00375489F9